MSIVTDKLKELAPKALPYIAVLVVGIAIGWGVKPSQVETREVLKVVEVEKQVVVEHETVRVEIVKVKDTQVVERWHREKTEERKPDGTVTTKEVEDKNIDSIVKERENSTEVKVVEVVKEVVVEKEVFKEKIVTPVLAQWHVGVLGGVQPQFSPSIGVASWAVGGEVERRIVGPLFLGVWGMGTTAGAGMGGLKVGFELP